MTDQATGTVEVLATADARREQILRAALAVIAERGYPDTRIADVAERTGISPALVIYYFKTRDHLLTEAIRYAEDQWYADSQRRMESLPTAALRLEELVAMSCLPEDDPDPQSSWLLWLDFWSQAARNPEVGALRRHSDERWRAAISSQVTAGQQAGEFRQVEPGGFAISLSALLDGMAVQIALREPAVSPLRAFELSMQYVADTLGFEWQPGRGRLELTQADWENGR